MCLIKLYLNFKINILTDLNFNINFKILRVKGKTLNSLEIFSIKRNNPFTFTEGWSLVCNFEQKNCRSNSFHGNDNSWTLPGHHYALLEADQRDCWLQQDGVLARTANSTMTILPCVLWRTHHFMLTGDHRLNFMKVHHKFV